MDENERNVFETPQKGPVFVPTIRHHQNEPTDPPIGCWHQHQTKMLVCHLCFREGGQFAWPKSMLCVSSTCVVQRPFKVDTMALNGLVAMTPLAPPYFFSYHA